MLFAVGGAWAVVQYRIGKIEDDQRAFKGAVDTLRDTIREEFDRAISRINQLLFEDGGTSRYLPRGEYEKSRVDCRVDMIRRIERLEGKAHEHQGPTSH